MNEQAAEGVGGRVSVVMQFSVALLVTGNLIGAGILGLPVIAGLCGAIPALLVMALFCVAMYYTACVIADETIAARSATFNYPSLYHRYLGSAGKWVAIVANMLILYGLLTAYLTGGGAILLQVIGVESSVVVNMAYFLLLTLLTVAGMTVIRRCNAVLVALMWISFFTIAVLGALHMEPGNFHHVYWPFLPVAVPVMLTSFHFHNIIPNLAEALSYNRRAIRTSMKLGMLFGLIMNAVWLLVGIGVVPLTGEADSLAHCYAANIPATIPMSDVIQSRAFLCFAMVFSMIAIVTSYVANGLGLMGFSRDLLSNYLGIRSAAAVIMASFLPPLVISQVNPHIFLKAINFVGGYGIVVLFGILPATIALMRRDQSRFRRVAAAVFLALFAMTLIFQCCLDFHVFTIRLPGQ